MIEFLFRLAIFSVFILSAISLLLLIPEFGTLIALATDTETVTGSINSFVGLLKQYVVPWIGLLNNILPLPIKSALLTLIVWQIIKPFVWWYIDFTIGLINKIARNA